MDKNSLCAVHRPSVRPSSPWSCCCVQHLSSLQQPAGEPSARTPLLKCCLNSAHTPAPPSHPHLRETARQAPPPSPLSPLSLLSLLSFLSFLSPLRQSPVFFSSCQHRSFHECSRGAIRYGLRRRRLQQPPTLRRVEGTPRPLAPSPPAPSVRSLPGGGRGGEGGVGGVEEGVRSAQRDQQLCNCRWRQSRSLRDSEDVSIHSPRETSASRPRASRVSSRV